MKRHIALAVALFAITMSLSTRQIAAAAQAVKSPQLAGLTATRGQTNTGALAPMTWYEGTQLVLPPAGKKYKHALVTLNLSSMTCAGDSGGCGATANLYVNGKPYMDGNGDQVDAEFYTFNVVGISPVTFAVIIPLAATNLDLTVEWQYLGATGSGHLSQVLQYGSLTAVLMD